MSIVSLFRHLLVLLVCVGTTAIAVDPLEIELVSDVRSIQSGQPFYLALALHHAPGYHSYWKHPGIVGVATDIRWDEHPGFIIEPITWPEPQHVKMFQIHCQGYERDVVLPMRVTPKAGVKLPAQITFSGKATWMCCNRECNPGFKELSITLPTSTRAELDASWSMKIQAELARQPQPSQAWKVDGVEKDRHVLLTLTPRPGAQPLTQSDVKSLRFFTLDGYIDTDKPQSFKLSTTGVLTADLIVADYVPGGRPKEFSGLMMRKGPWQEGANFRALEFRVAWK